MKIKKLLIDLDGTLLNGFSEINESRQFITKLQTNKIEFLIMTNSIKSPKEIKKRLINIGIDIVEKRILNPISAINSYLDSQSITKAYIVGSKLEINQVLAIQDKSNPEIIILLDFEKENINYNELQSLFTLIQKNIPIIAASGSPYYIKSDLHYLDTGAFVKLLENAGSITIDIFGKPSKCYYNEGRKLLNCDPKNILVIGDDWRTDITGALESGFNAVLVKSGKYKPKDEKNIQGLKCIESLQEIFKFL
jgi:phospholysine phosphohistidine inorganic pyrophosphate phosphatase